MIIKKTVAIVVFGLLVAFVLSVSPIFQVLAQTPTDQNPTVSQSQQTKIDDLKERVATRVAQIRTQNYKAVVGEIKTAGNDSIVLKTRQGEKKIVLNDEAKIFTLSRTKKSAITSSSLKAGDQTAVIGSTDAAESFVAKVILVKSLPLSINGVIEKIDKDNAVISVKSPSNASYNIDIETTTKIQSWAKDDGFAKSGFSKLQVGSRVHVNGLRLTTEANRLSAARVLVLPTELTATVPATSPSVATTPTAKTASPTPTKKVTPTPTP